MSCYTDSMIPGAGYACDFGISLLEDSLQKGLSTHRLHSSSSLWFIFRILKGNPRRIYYGAYVHALEAFPPPGLSVEVFTSKRPQGFWFHCASWPT